MSFGHYRNFRRNVESGVFNSLDAFPLLLEFSRRSVHIPVHSAHILRPSDFGWDTEQEMVAYLRGFKDGIAAMNSYSPFRDAICLETQDRATFIGTSPYDSRETNIATYFNTTNNSSYAEEGLLAVASLYLTGDTSEKLSFNENFASISILSQGSLSTGPATDGFFDCLFEAANHALTYVALLHRKGEIPDSLQGRLITEIH